VPDAEVIAITHGNAMRVFPTTRLSTCRARRRRSVRCAQAKHVDVRPTPGKGGKRPSDYAPGHATIADVIKQMAGAFAVAFRDDQGVDAAAVRQRLMERAQRATQGKRLGAGARDTPRRTRNPRRLLARRLSLARLSARRFSPGRPSPRPVPAAGRPLSRGRARSRNGSARPARHPPQRLRALRRGIHSGDSARAS